MCMYSYQLASLLTITLRFDHFFALQELKTADLPQTEKKPKKEESMSSPIVLIPTNYVL